MDATPDPTRAIAWDLLHAVLDLRRPLDDALDAQTGFDARDRAAAHRLAAAVLRRMGTLDAVLEPFLQRAPPDGVRHALRLGAAGLLLLDTPPHAAVATAGGYTYRANQKVVAVQHLGAPGEERFRVTSSLQVSAGDTVRVLERFF